MGPIINDMRKGLKKPIKRQLILNSNQPSKKQELEGECIPSYTRIISNQGRIIGTEKVSETEGEIELMLDPNSCPSIHHSPNDCNCQTISVMSQSSTRITDQPNWENWIKQKATTALKDILRADMRSMARTMPSARNPLRRNEIRNGMGENKNEYWTTAMYTDIGIETLTQQVLKFVNGLDTINWSSKERKGHCLEVLSKATYISWCRKIKKSASNPLNNLLLRNALCEPVDLNEISEIVERKQPHLEHFSLIDNPDQIDYKMSWKDIMLAETMTGSQEIVPRLGQAYEESSIKGKFLISQMGSILDEMFTELSNILSGFGEASHNYFSQYKAVDDTTELPIQI